MIVKLTPDVILGGLLASQSSGGGVETVTGDSVDNTDPLNPVIDIDSDDVENLSTVAGVTVTEALDELGQSTISPIDNGLIDIIADNVATIPFFIMQQVLFSFTVTDEGAYRVLGNLGYSMSSTNRSFQLSLNVNGSPVSFIGSVERKDSTDIAPFPIYRNLGVLNAGDEISVTFGPEFFPASATIRAGSQIEILRSDA